MNNKNARAIALAVSTVLLGTAGVAAANPAGPSYNYVQAGYVNLDLDGGGSADGFGLQGSFAVGDQFHIFADYVQVKESPVTVDVTTLGGGWNMPIADTTDFVARVGWVRAGAKITGLGSGSDDGWMVQGGIRSMITPAFELNAFITHTDVGGSDTSIGGGAVYHFGPNIGLFGGVDFSDGDSLAQFGVRFSF